jgi:hypothetical protein
VFFDRLSSFAWSEFPNADWMRETTIKGRFAENFCARCGWQRAL